MSSYAARLQVTKTHKTHLQSLTDLADKKGNSNNEYIQFLLKMCKGYYTAMQKIEGIEDTSPRKITGK